MCALLLRSEDFERKLLLLLDMLKEKVKTNRSRKKKQKKERFFLTGVCKKFRRASRVHHCVYVCALLLRSEVFERKLLLLLDMLKEKQMHQTRREGNVVLSPKECVGVLHTYTPDTKHITYIDRSIYARFGPGEPK
jgi:hypothetical protein